MSEDGSNQISNRIDQKLAGLSKTKSNNQFIFRIHQTLRRENEVAYEPEMLSIGPYHHGKSNLLKMEKYKLNYLTELLKRRGESSVERYVAALVEVEEEARNYYGEQIGLNQDDFVEMMLLDGCFIVEFLRKFNMDEENRNGDPLFAIWSLAILCRDLLLFENQLPFFVLLKLFEMTKTPSQDEDLIHLAISSLYHCISPYYNPPESAYAEIDPKYVCHLLGLIYVWCCSPFLEATDTEVEDEEDQSSSVNQNRSDFLAVPMSSNVEQEDNPMDVSSNVEQVEDPMDVSSNVKQDEDPKHMNSNVEQEEDPMDIEFIGSVLELEQHGVKLKKADTGTSMLDIQFNRGIIEIPSFVVQDITESVLRNLIAYEEYMFDLGYSGKFVTDYATFMDCLINTSNDVTKLRDKKIIKNWLGDDEAVAKIFNKIGNNVFIFPPAFTYAKIFNDVNKHCSRRRHKYMANLRERYFNNPWSTIALLAATVLLLLTLIQTVFAALQHGKKTEVVRCNCK